MRNHETYLRDGVTIELKAGIPLGSYPKNWLQTATKDGSTPEGMSSRSTTMLPPLSAVDHLRPLIFSSRKRVLPGIYQNIIKFI